MGAVQWMQVQCYGCCSAVDADAMPWVQMKSNSGKWDAMGVGGVDLFLRTAQDSFWTAALPASLALAFRSGVLKCMFSFEALWYPAE